MLYIYSICYEIKDTDKESEAKEIMENRMKNCKELKLYREYNDDGCVHFVSKLDTVIIDGVNVRADMTLSDFIETEWYSDAHFDIESSCLETDLRIEAEYGVKLLVDALREEDNKWDYNIYNADIPEDKIRNLIIMFTLEHLKTALNELEEKCKKARRLYSQGKFKWYETI